MNWDRLEWVSLPSCSPLFVVRWGPPSGWVKINFDGFIFSSISRGGARFVARDHDGKLILQQASLCLTFSSLAEMIVVWDAIKVAVFRIGATELWIEGDVLGII